MNNYYPLAPQNEWHYKQNGGDTYINKIVAANDNEFTMHNSAFNKNSIVRSDGNLFTTDALEAGNFQQWLKNDLQQGDRWSISFKANGLDCIMIMTVKEKDIEKSVEGKNFTNVILIEAESKMMMNSNIVSLNFFTQYYYADGIGLILTTSSAGDKHALIDYQLN
ncbi:MAG: hypothetical protein QM737_21220 [Ferruginibacter sp.]